MFTSKFRVISRSAIRTAIIQALALGRAPDFGPGRRAISTAWPEV